MISFLAEWLERAISEQCIYLFNHRDFTDDEKISEGAFGIIRKSKWASYKLTVALKSLKIDTTSNDNAKKVSEDFIEEHSKNILVHEGKMKIADFGLSTTLNSINYKMTNSRSYGMPAYVDPQWQFASENRTEKKGLWKRYGEMDLHTAVSFNYLLGIRATSADGYELWL
ncbi:2213_t:CDS:2 [Cetraspora pellucida]|uniref:2213_t:CDS:1 n=1 Tax=Cetraspora pellucida TaxID=1433469 RepID=A0ACA9JXG9_9GLOM|nr:2213_t:CDS:2 [Cetraspora pellucida]